jgi:hypothetical protein
MCSLVTGGKGSSRYPTSTGAEVVSSLVVSCVLMVVGTCVRRKEEMRPEDIYPEIMTPSLGESSRYQGKVLVGQAIQWLRLDLTSELSANQP